MKLIHNVAKPISVPTTRSTVRAPNLSMRGPTANIATDAVRDPAVYIAEMPVRDQPNSFIKGSTKTEIEKDWPGPEIKRTRADAGRINQP